MLQAISWKDYLTTMGLGLVIYYAWWMIRYYPGWKASRRGMNEAAPETDVKAVGGDEKVPPVKMGGEIVQMEVKKVKEERDNGMIEDAAVSPAVVGQPVFLPGIAAQFLSKIRTLPKEMDHPQII